MVKKTCMKIQWSDLHVREGYLPCCPECKEDAELVIGLMGEPGWVHKETDVIQLTDLALGQKVRMIDIYDGKEGIITKQVIPAAYEITIGSMAIVTGKQYFEIIPE